MQQFIGKKYKLKSSENFDEYLKYIDIETNKRANHHLHPIVSLQTVQKATDELSHLRTQLASNYPGSLMMYSMLLSFKPYYYSVGYLSRKTANSVSPVCTLTLNKDGSYTLAMLTTFRNVFITFRLNEEFIEERADGTKVKSLMVVEGNKLIQTQIEDNGRKSTHVREFTPTSLTVTSTADGWNGKCVRVYELVE